MRVFLNIDIEMYEYVRFYRSYLNFKRFSDVSHWMKEVFVCSISNNYLEGKYSRLKAII